MHWSEADSSARPRTITSSHGSCDSLGETNSTKDNVMPVATSLVHAKKILKRTTQQFRNKEKASDEEKQCPICSKTFSLCGSLQRHTRICHSSVTEAGDTAKKSELHQDFNNSSRIKSPKQLSTCGTTFTCTLCFQSFRKRGWLEKHLETHKVEKVNSSQDTSKDEELNHLNRTSPMKPAEKSATARMQFVCTVCFRKFSKEGWLIKHQEMHKIRTRNTGDTAVAHKCSVCTRTFSNKYLLTRHQKAHQNTAKEKHLETHEVEKLGSSQDTSKDEDLNHLNKTSPMKPAEKSATARMQFVCAVCFRKFSKEGWLIKHQEMHKIRTRNTGNTAVRHKCSVCSRTFSNKYLLTRHRKAHQNTKPQTRTIANKRVTKDISPNSLQADLRENYKEHIKTEQNIEMSAVEMSEVGEQFSIKYEKTDESERANPFGNVSLDAVQSNCQILSQSQLPKVRERRKTDSHLRKDGLGNADETPIGEQHTHKAYGLSCKSYNSLDTCLHSGKMQHSCKVCNKMFDQLVKLKRHSSVHCKEKGHACEFCNRKFPTLSGLKIHILANKAFKPYECKLCEFSCDYRCEFNRHKEDHSEETLYICTLCNKTFASSHLLDQHIKLHSSDSSLEVNNAVGRSSVTKRTVRRAKSYKTDKGETVQVFEETVSTIISTLPARSEMTDACDISLNNCCAVAKTPENC